MRLAFFSFIFLFSCVACAQNPYEGQLVNTDYFEVIPYRYVKGKVLIPARIDTSTYWFILDTGGQLIISPKLKEAHQMPVVGDIKVGGVNNTSQVMAKVACPTVHVGALEFEGYHAIVSDFFDQYPVSCFEADGLIGRDFLLNSVLQFDHENMQVILTDQRDKLGLDDHVKSRMSLRGNGTPLIEVRLNDGEKNMIVFDSGSDDLFSFKRKTAQKLRKFDRLVWEGTLSYGINMQEAKKQVQYMVHLDSVEIAGMVYRDFYSDISKESQNRVGTKIIEYGLATLDFPEKHFYYKPYSEQADLEPLTHFGVALEIRDGSYLVRAVAKDSQADKAGLKAGMTILTINGEPAPTSEDQKCTNYLYGHAWKEADSVEVVYREKKKRKARKLVLEKIIR